MILEKQYFYNSHVKLSNTKGQKERNKKLRHVSFTLPEYKLNIMEFCIVECHFPHLRVYRKTKYNSFLISQKNQIQQCSMNYCGNSYELLNRLLGTTLWDQKSVMGSLQACPLQFSFLYKLQRQSDSGKKIMVQTESNEEFKYCSLVCSVEAIFETGPLEGNSYHSSSVEPGFLFWSLFSVLD